MTREASVERNTKETQIKLKLKSWTEQDIQILKPAWDFLITCWTDLPRHGLFDLKRTGVHGDLNVDDHHTIEDTGIVLGNAIKEAVGDKKGIRRYGSCILPMDEVLVLCASRSVRTSLFLPGMQSLPQRRSEIWPQRW